MQTVAERYVIVRPLGAGGLADAYVVRDRIHDAELALKLVPAEAPARKILEREFLALRSARHPHLVAVHDFGFWRPEVAGPVHAFYTSTYVDGARLDGFAAGRDWAAVSNAVADVLSALGALHARGLLHGDLHPGNVLVDRDGRGVLIDLSCARPITFDPGFPISGTPGFIAPEVLRGEAQRASDLYSLGATIRSLGLELPAAVARAVARLVDDRPERRPATAEDAAVALGLPWRATPASARLGSALVGRASELGRLRGAVEAVRTLAIVGEAGSGRTRLLEETKLAAQLRMTTIVVPGQPGMLARLLAVATGEPVEETISSVLRAHEKLVARGRPVALLIDDADALPPDERGRLQAFLRVLEPARNVAVILSSTVEIEGVESVRLAPLDRNDVRSWLGAEVPLAALDELLRETGGYPKEIAAVLHQLDGSGWDSRTLARAAARSGTTRGPLAIDDLEPRARSLLATIVAGGAVSVSSALDSLIERGLVVVSEREVRLLRRSDGLRAATALGSAEMEAAHRRLADEACAELARHPAVDAVRVRAIGHLANVDPLRAFALLPEATPANPAAYRAALDALVPLAPQVEPHLVVRCAELYAEAGEPARALGLLVHVLRRRPAAMDRHHARRVAGNAYARMGDSRRAARVLGRLLPSCGAGERGAVAAGLSLALLKRGDDREAFRVSEETLALGDAVEPGARLDLLLNAAYATSRQGDATAARGYLERARELDRLASPRARFRLASAMGFIEYGSGQTLAAIRAYKTALDLAERQGFDDLVPSAALNYGSACHELGDLGPALDAYTRGQALALAIGMPTTSTILEFDRAKVLADIGCFVRAGHHAESARASARREGMPLIEAGARAVLAQLDAFEGNLAGAARHFDEAEALARSASPRETTALALERSRAFIAGGEPAPAARTLARLAPVIQELGMPDVEADYLAVRGALAIAEGRTPQAIADLERGLELLGQTGRRSLLAELTSRLGEAFAAAGSGFLAARHRARARELWEKTLAGLPPDLHDEFRRHPVRASAFVEPLPRVEAEPVLDVRRLVEINRRLNSGSTTSAVLEEAMDAAISISRAERGFLLLDEGEGALKVVVARNLDRETIRQGNLKFSRTVAERVLRTGDPVIAVDAADDPRFTRARSVHAMKLKSVLCVPIRSASGALGAIYVDHRFSSGSFRPELVDALLALGDQAAIAIVKARLVDELREKTRELEERNAEVERLAHGQALEIARLKRVRDEGGTKSTAKRRFDYADLVARSPRMQRVLSTLDRVIDTDITVLVRGESGTGKERVARAVHANSPRAKKPFVAINCGALPEPLLEAELFGYRRGAFSGAVRDHPGVFVAAHGGSLFLDELGEMPASMQVKLLRVLQEHEVRPLGATESLTVDVRLICATNRDLAADVRSGRFREDLFYRIAVVDMELPPLRERIEDLLPLAEAILGRLSRELGRPLAVLDRTAERALLAHAWPGNVRELENVLTKAALLSATSTIGADDLELGTEKVAARGPALRGRILAALEEADWNVVEAARLLDMPRATLYRKMRRFAIERPPR